MANQLPFYTLTKTDFLNELQTTNKYVQSRLTDLNFNKYVKNHTAQRNVITSRCNYHNIDEIKNFINRNNNKLPSHIGITQTNMVHFNIRSLDKHFGELMAFHDQTENIFEYTALSEIGKKNLESRKALLQSMGLDLHYKESHLSKGGAGLITKKDAEHKIRHDLAFKNTKFNKVNLVTESIWLEREFKDIKKNYIIGVIYRHPGSTKECLEDFTNQLNNILVKIEKENKKIYIMGDLNIDGMKVSYNKQVSTFFNMLMDKNLIPLITKPTRVQDTSISLIDHAMVNASCLKSEANIKSGVIYSGITDHLPVFLAIQENHRTVPKDRPLMRIYNEKNKNSFYKELEKCNWDQFKETINVTTALQLFYKNWKECHDKSFPLMKLSRSKTKIKPWINDELAKEIRYKNNLHKIALLNPTSENKEKFRKLRNSITNKTRRAHGNFYQKIINGEKQNLKTLWDLFGKVVNTQKMRDGKKIRELKSKEKKITNDKDIADTLNDFFCGIGQELAKKHNDDLESYKKYMGQATKDSIELIPTNKVEVFDIIRMLKKKSCGADEIHPRLLLHCRSIIAPLLAHLYNLSFEQTVYPDLLKIAKVIPIFKKQHEEEREEPGNYRPISLLSALNKILEKLIYKRLMKFIDKNNILYKYQFGFRRTHSTTLALIDVIDNIRKNLHQGKKVAGVYIDFSKAFDCVNHHILLQKLQHYGINGKMLQLIESYLTGRKQFTVANGTVSNTKEINCGVPQGSVLGPLLFLIYSNDIQNCTTEVLKLFADDSNGFIFENDYTTLKTKIKSLLKELFKWSTDNKLTINTSKTCYTIFHSPKSNIPEQLNSIKIKPKEINQVSDTKTITIKREQHSKYLGLHLDELLNWEYQISDLDEGILPKLTKINNSFKIIKHYIPENNRMLMFNAYFASKLYYGIELIGSADNTLIHKLQVKQNRALKILFNKDFYTPTTKLHKDLKVLKVEDAYRFNMAKFVFKQQNNLLPGIFKNHYTKIYDTHSHKTRQNELLKIDNSPNNSQHREKMSTIIGAKIWNEIPAEIRKAKTLATFKMQCKAYYINKYNQTQ